MDVWISILLFVALFFVGRNVGIFLHEMGHASAAVLCGWKPLLVKVGSGPALLTFLIGDWQFQWTGLPNCGIAKMTAQKRAYFRIKNVIMCLSGPLFTAWFIFFLVQTLRSLPSSSPGWLSGCLSLLVFFEAVTLITCLVPTTVKIDGKYMPTDMLHVWRTMTMKRDLIGAHFAGNVVGEALIYLERGQNDRAHSMMESKALVDSDISPREAKFLWIAILLAEGKREEANRAKKSLLDGGDFGGKSRVEILDGLACIPLFHGFRDSLDDGLECIEEALRGAPGMITLKGTKGSLLIEVGRVEEGLKLIEEVMATSTSENDQAISLYYKALALSELGNRAEGRRLLREARDKYPACVVRTRVEKRFWNDPE